MEIKSPAPAPTTNCTIQALPIGKVQQTITYAKVAEANKKTSSILKFEFTTTMKTSSDIKHASSSVMAIIIGFAVSVIINLL